MTEPVTRSSSILTRLTSMVAGILVAAVLLVGCLALLWQYRQLHQALNTKGTTLVQFMAQVMPLSILSLNFVQLHNYVKKVVLYDEEAVYAIVLNEQRAPLAFFFKEGDPLLTAKSRGLVAARMPLLAAQELKNSERILEVSAPIQAAEKRIGQAILGFSTEKMRRALMVQFGLIGAALVVTILGSVALLRVTLLRLLRPVQQLTAAATQISRGDLNVSPANIGRSDEVGVLCRAFESMAGQLRELVAGLQSREDDLHRLTIFQSTILDNAAYGIISMTPEGVVSSFNRAAERLLGYSAQEVIGLQTPELWHDTEELRQRALELSLASGQTVEPGFKAVVAPAAGGAPDEREWTFIRKDRSRVPVLFTVTALLGDNGAVTGFVGLGYDLTERKRADEERRESETRYRRIVDTAIEGVCTLAPDATITFINDRMAEMLGRPEAEILGRSLAEFLFEEDLPDHAQKMENRRLGISESYERRLRRMDGTELWTLASATPVRDEEDRFLGSFGMFNDITERKHAEEELHRLKDELEQRVHQRTSELEEKNRELERMNRLFVGRECKMAELKQRIRELEQGSDGP
ncbi:PAS domain S-box protein [Geomonas anaerohicana]|uniref:PAS domain S-box protein n=1 Tax=Geomonas anaerohicana TaxID=2798583 RepID=A0ABS0YI68_9BACT|nr:PAS domain S-box protein [Geomonas anaerohicana]MBJ6752048.1 PAS domain S-box protein [Geomonas anaerohicana]